MKKKWLAALVIAPFAIAAIVAIGGGVVMYLWNWLMPTLFGLSPVTFWQAFGLLALCRILFGGMGGRRGGMHRSHWTPEQKQRFRHAVRSRFGGQGEASPLPE